MLLPFVFSGYQGLRKSQAPRLSDNFLTLHSLAMVIAISSFSSLQRGPEPKYPQAEDECLLPLFSSLDLSFLSSCCENQFLLTQQPVSESWDSLYLSIPRSSPHPPALSQKLSEGTPESPMFLSSEFQDLQFLHCKREKIYPFSSSLAYGDQKAGDLSPHPTLSKLLPFPAAPQLSKPAMAQRLQEPHKAPRGHGGKLQAF